MKRLKLPGWILMIFAAVALFVGCSDDEAVNNRESDYGYVQFKLFKEASYEAHSRAIKSELDFLAEASKMKITLTYGETTIAQTLTLSSAGAELAEFGLRSDKLKLLTGNYRVITFTLYDMADEPIYNGSTEGESTFTVTPGGLTQHDLTADVTPRGSVRFTLVKDLSGFDQTRAVERQYTFDEIHKIDVTVQNRRTNEQVRFEQLPAKFKIHFDEQDQVEDGYQTSSLQCDTLLSIKAGDYRLVSYETYDNSGVLLEQKNNPKAMEFSVLDNKTTETNLPITLYEADDYVQDYYALREIWESLNGSTWYYAGQKFPRGVNWDFNKDPDLWGDQPGVELHPNGRVARIDISDFAFSGHLSPAIGQLTALVELYLGTHNDVNLYTYDPSLALDLSLQERVRTRLERHKKFLKMIHPSTPMSEPCARALKEKGLTSPAAELYDHYSEADLIDRKTGAAKQIRPMDTNYGTLCNGLKSLPKEIGRLVNLEFFCVANSELESIPEEFANLTSLTDLEVYNCPKMEKFPMALTQLPELVSLNISNNCQWSPEEIYRGMDGLANGPSNEKLQILYARQNSLEELPESFNKMKKIGLLDLAYNKISKIHPLTREVAPIQLYLDDNLLEELPKDAEGYFCGYDDVETFSMKNNRLTKLPNIFSSNSRYTIADADFSGNMITGCEGEEDGTYKGINVETFTLSHNPLMKYPKALSDSNSKISYIILRGCQIEEIPEGSFSHEQAILLVSMDISYNNLKKIPREFHAGNMPYFYGLDLSFNSFDHFPFEPLDCSGLTVFALRSQRDEQGARCMRQWPKGIFQHTGLRALYLGSNDLRLVEDTISTLIYMLDISDNPNIIFDASDICYAWQVGAYMLIYDKTQQILNCDYMLE